MLNQKSNFKSLSLDLLTTRDQNHNSKVKNDFKERCYNYSLTVIKLIKDLPEKRVYRVISDQLLPSATSIGANIVEAKSASSKRDYVKYYETALKSTNETRYWLGLFRDALNVDKIEINQLLKETCELATILAASLPYNEKQETDLIFYLCL